jgi:DNA-directed RNA polymerase specialized sigma24 family protein
MDDSAKSGDTSQYFPHTNWFYLDRLKHDNGAERQPILDLLASHYWTPIVAYLVRRGYDSHQAQDLAQDFFSFALESRLFDKADRARGRFRSLLLTSLKHFAAKARRHDEAGKRSPPGGWASLEELLQEDAAPPASLVQTDPTETFFHQTWLREVVANALRRLQQEFESSGKSTHFELFRSRVVAPELENAVPRPLETQAEELGLDFKEAANQILTAKRAFKRLLIREVRSYAVSEEDSCEELREVLGLLGLEA